jgi:iron-sulfur cluster repair protein YtfE (RIC family)
MATSTTQTDWTSAPIAELVTHLVATHHRATTVLLERLQRVAHAFGPPIQAAAQALARELLAHQQQEESAVFPICVALDQALHEQEPPAINATPAVHLMAQGHERWRVGVDKLRTAVAQARADHPQWVELKACLDALCADLQEHSWKEEQILLPAVLFSQDLLHARRAALERAGGEGPAATIAVTLPSTEGHQP